MWDKFDEATMGIVVRHIKRFIGPANSPSKPLTNFASLNSSALPDYVFGEGERQPKLAQKRPKPSKVCAPGKLLFTILKQVYLLYEGIWQIEQHITRYAKQETTVGALFVRQKHAPHPSLLSPLGHQIQYRNLKRQHL